MKTNNQLEADHQAFEKMRRRRRFETRLGAVHRRNPGPSGRPDKHPKGVKAKKSWKGEQW